MRTLMNFGLGALIALGVVLWVILMMFAWVTTSILSFVVWLASDGLPVTIGAALIALAIVGAAWWSRRKVRA